MVSRSSMTDPGQPCVMISGNACSCRDLTWMKWMSESVDLGLELRQGVQSRLALAPVVLGRPVAGELLECGQLHALRPIADEFPARPARRRDTTAEVSQLLVRHVDLERYDLARGVGGATHDDLRCQ